MAVTGCYHLPLPPREDDSQDPADGCGVDVVCCCSVQRPPLTRSWWPARPKHVDRSLALSRERQETTGPLLLHTSHHTPADGLLVPSGSVLVTAVFFSTPIFLYFLQVISVFLSCAPKPRRLPARLLATRSSRALLLDTSLNRILCLPACSTLVVTILPAAPVLHVQPRTRTRTSIGIVVG